MASSSIAGKFFKDDVFLDITKTVLEIGTFTGYAMVSMAEGITDGSKIITIDKDEELSKKLNPFRRHYGKRQDFCFGWRCDGSNSNVD